MKAGVDGARDYGRRASCFLMYTVVPASTRVARASLARLPSRISEHDWTRLAHARPLGEESERLDERPPKFFAACRSPYSLCVCVLIAFCESVCLYRLLPFLRRPTRSRDDEAAARQALLRRRQRESRASGESKRLDTDTIQALSIPEACSLADRPAFANHSPPAQPALR